VCGGEWRDYLTVLPHRGARSARPAYLKESTNSGPLAQFSPATKHVVTDALFERTVAIGVHADGHMVAVHCLPYQNCCSNMKDCYFLVVVSAVVCTGRNMWPSLVDRHVHSGNTVHIGIFQCAALRVRVNDRRLQPSWP
jgi:hypothetical protein